MSSSWLEELEARLNAQLEDFLRANPRQEELLAEQEARDRQIQLRQERLALQQRAEATRQRLLQLAEEIRCWQLRRDKASAAGATDLATRAEAHLAALMEQGRRDWQTLTELGQRFSAIEADLDALSREGAAGRPSATPLPGTKAAGPPSAGGSSGSPKPGAGSAQRPQAGQGHQVPRATASGRRSHDPAAEIGRAHV